MRRVWNRDGHGFQDQEQFREGCQTARWKLHSFYSDKVPPRDTLAEFLQRTIVGIIKERPDCLHAGKPDQHDAARAPITFEHLARATPDQSLAAVFTNERSNPCSVLIVPRFISDIHVHEQVGRHD